MRAVALVGTLCIAIALLGCGGGSSSDAAQSAAEAKKRPKPTVRVPSGPAPKDLVVKDLIEGSGPQAKKGDRLAIHYVGVNFRTGEEFETSWSASVPFPFQLGTGEVLEGWDRGLPGMRVGGRRELVVPPGLAYKAGPLVYVIDLLEVE